MKLEDQLKGAIRLKQYSIRTEESYVGWYRRFVLWHQKKHPAEMGAAEVESFLTHLAVNRGLSAVSQNQALNALVFLYKEVLKIDLADIDAKRAKQTRHLPVVLTVEEVSELLKGVSGEAGLVCKLLYGCGLRVSEALALRIKDVDLGGSKLEVRNGKGGKDRVITLPKTLRQPLSEHRARVEQMYPVLPSVSFWTVSEHRARVEQMYQQDRKAGVPGVFLPYAMEVKHPAAATSWEWFWMFPGASLSQDPRTGIVRRHHLHDVNISRELNRATKRAGLNKRVTAHALRHSYATHLILRGVDIRSIQDLLGHSDVRTTEIYTQVAKAMRGDITSPLDDL